MKMADGMTIPQTKIIAYNEFLISEGRANSSVREHMRYANRFVEFIGGRRLCAEVLNEYRKYLDERYTTCNSKNSCISHVNSLLRFLGAAELVLPYFETSRSSMKLKTSMLTDEDIDILLSYADNYSQGRGID